MKVESLEVKGKLRRSEDTYNWIIMNSTENYSIENQLTALSIHLFQKPGSRNVSFGIDFHWLSYTCLPCKLFK